MSDEEKQSRTPTDEDIANARSVYLARIAGVPRASAEQRAFFATQALTDVMDFEDALHAGLEAANDKAKKLTTAERQGFVPTDWPRDAGIGQGSASATRGRRG